MTKVAVLLALLSPLVAADVARAQAAPQSKGAIIERVLVRVNGEIFTQSQLTQRQTDAIRDRNRGAQDIPDATVMKLLNDVTPDLLVDAVDELLLAQHGRELGAKFTDVEFKSAIETIKKENNLDDAGLKQAMTQEGLTMDQLRTNFERAYMIQAVQSQEVFRRMNITEEELRQYYAGHKDSLMTPETVTLREITVAVTTGVSGGLIDMRAAGSAAAKTKIDGIRARALAGEDFAALATDLSDSATKTNGGLIGPISVEDMNPTLKVMVEKLTPGSITEPVELPRGGYQLFKLESREVAGLPPFEKTKDKIEQAVRAERLAGEMRKIVARLRAQAVVEWKDDALKLQYQKRVVERAAAAAQ